MNHRPFGSFLKPVAVAAVLAVSALANAAQVIYVSPDGNDANSGLSWGSAKRTVGGALQAASGPTQLWLRQGVYREMLTIDAAGIELYGGFAGDEASLEARHGGATVLDAGSQGRVLRLNRAHGTVLDRLTLRNGNAVGFGGGLYSYQADNVRLTDVVVEDCTSYTGNHGGGIAVANGSIELTRVLVQRCSTAGSGGGINAVGAGFKATELTVRECTAARGGGLAMDAGLGYVTCSRFERNVATSTALEGGGAIWLRRVQQVPFTRNFFVENEAVYGSAADLYDYTSTDVTNNVFSRNRAGSATILIRGYGAWPRLTHNTIADNVATVGNSAVYVADRGNGTFRNELIAYNRGPRAAVGRDGTADYNWSYANFWMNDFGAFDSEQDLQRAGPTTTHTDPKFLNRTFLDDPLSYELSPDSTVLDYGYLYAYDDFNGAARPVNSTGKAQAYPDKGAFEFQGVAQNVDLAGWRGPNGDGDQSFVKLRVRVRELNGALVAEDELPQASRGFYLLRGERFAAGAGPFEVEFRVPGYLCRKVTLSALPAHGSTGVDLDLIPGDVNGDNKVDMHDVALMVLFADRTDPRTDLNGDGITDVRDLSLTLSSFGRVGD